METKTVVRTAVIMLSIMVFEGWGFVAMLGHATPGQIGGLLVFHPRARLGWLVGLLVAGIYVWGSARSLPFISENFFRITPLKALAVPFALLSGVVEELLFRRVVMDGLQHAHHSWAVQLIASAVTFGLLHSVFGLFAGSWRGMISPVLWTTALGLALAATYLTGARDVAPCIWSHTLINICIEPWLLMAVMRRSVSRSRPA